MKNEEWTPGKILEISSAYWMTCTLHAAVKLDIFTIIGEKGTGGEMAAKRLNTDIDATIRLLDAVTAMGLLEKKGGVYTNSPAAKTFLCKDVPSYLGHIIMHHHHLVQGWSMLDQAVTTGKPVKPRTHESDYEKREAFLMGMFNLAMNLAPQLVPCIDLRNRKHLLDLGGGPGTYAIHFCKENPGLSATVFDLPTTQPFAEKTIEAFGLGDRIDFFPGSFIEDDLPKGADVAWLSHILHGESPDDCARIIKKTASALETGSMIIIHDFILNNASDGPLFPTLFSLNMLLATPKGRAYTADQLKKMLSDAGFEKIRRIDFKSPNDSGLICAELG